jgi:rhodanese-related sulfurtransferase
VVGSSTRSGRRKFPSFWRGTVDRLIEFSTNHPILVMALALVLGMLIAGEFRNRLRGFADIGPTEATELLNHDDAITLDVRESAEFEQGHILNAIHIPRSLLADRVKELDKHRGKAIIVYCATGNRSIAAGRMLKANGHEKVYNLAGGIHAWKNASLPVTRK